MKTKRMPAQGIAGVILLLAGGVFAAEPAATAPSSPKGYTGQDWPCWRGPNRNGVAPSSPKLLDRLPPNGPKLLWKSEYIPFSWKGGWGSVVVAEGKVFLYVFWSYPEDGGIYPRPITAKFLKTLGWIPGVPDDLAKKLEAAWASPQRPDVDKCPSTRTLCGIPDNLKDFFNQRPDLKLVPPSPGLSFNLDAFLAKLPDLKAYVDKFMATLDPKDAQKYGEFIKYRLCMKKDQETLTWERLVKLSTFQDQEVKNPEDAVGSECDSICHCIRYAGFTRDTLVCLDANTGELLWKKAFGEPFHPPSADYYPQSTTPAVANGKVYFYGLSGTHCLSTKDGSVIWENKNGGWVSSILVDGGLVFAPDFAMAYDANTGRLLWQTDDGHSGVRSPVLWTGGGKKCILSGDTLLNEADGKTLWKADRGMGKGRGGTPVVQGEYLVDSTRGKSSICKITSDKPPVLLRKLPFSQGGAESCGSLLLYQGCVYGVVDDTWACADLATGKINWENPEAGFAAESSPILADGKVIVFGPGPGTSNGNGGCGTGWWVYIFKATPEKYEEVGRFYPHAASCQSPAIVNGKLYFRVQSDKDIGDFGVACYDLTEAGNKPTAASAPEKL